MTRSFDDLSKKYGSDPEDDSSNVSNTTDISAPSTQYTFDHISKKYGSQTAGQNIDNETENKIPQNIYQRVLGKGIYDLGTLAAQPVTMVPDLAIGGINAAIRKLTPDAWPSQRLQLPTLSNITSEGLQTLGGIPPQDKNEQIGLDALKSIGGAKTLSSAASAAEGVVQSPIGKKLLGLFQGEGIPFYTGAVGGTVAGDIAKEKGAPFPIQLGAMIAGGAGGSALGEIGAGLANKGIRSLLGNPSPEQASANLELYQNAGIDPTAYQIAGTPGAASTAKNLANVSGSSGNLYNQGIRLQQDVKSALDDTTKSISPTFNPSVDTPENLGAQLYDEIRGTRTQGNKREGGAISNLFDNQKDLGNQLNSSFDQKGPVILTNYKSRLQDLTTENPELGNSIDNLSNKFLDRLSGSLQKDIEAKKISPETEYGFGYGDAAGYGPGEGSDTTFSVGSARKLLTQIDDKIRDWRDTPGQSGSTKDLKSIRGALQQDIESAALNQGDKVSQSYNNFNQQYGDIAQKINQLKFTAPKDATGGRVITNLFKGSGEDSARLDAVLPQLSPEMQQKVAALKLAGMREPGTDSFADNWSKVINKPELTPNSKAALFGDNAKRLDAISQVNQSLREGPKIFSNPNEVPSSGISPAAQALLGGYAGTKTGGLIGGIGGAALPWALGKMIGNTLLAKGAGAILPNQTPLAQRISQSALSSPAIQALLGMTQ